MTFKCAHISDIHWRGLKRHEEYQAVFIEMFKELENLELDAIFIGGDIVHSKTQGISPELIDMLTWWFESLANISPTYVILGNHDGLILNESRQDAITPIIKAMNNDNIYLYKNSGVYPLAVNNTGLPINWCVFSCFDEKNWGKVIPVEDEINIACFHGAVLGSKTDTDWELEGEVKLGFFENFDFGFLGDIHKVQYLNEEKSIAYPGSTIQQNYGEDINKGFLYWEIESKHEYRSRFIKIENPHPFLTIDWKGDLDTTVHFAEKVKEGVRWRVRSDLQISQAEIQLLHHFLKENKKAHEIVYQLNKNNIDNKYDSEVTKENSLNIRNNSDRLRLLNSFYEGSGISESDILKIDKVFKKNLDLIPEDLVDVAGQKWSINSMSFDNTFSYGRENFIDFDKLNGVVGLFGNNRAGKSSIPGTLMYCLYNTTDRGSMKNINIVNTRKGSCKATVNFTIGTEKYEVSRSTEKKTSKKGVTGSLTNLYLNKLNGEFLDDKTEEQRRETEKVLRKIIGTSEDFLYTSFSSQGENNIFIKEKNTARKQIISKFLNLQVYDELYKSSRENHIVLKNKLKSITEIDWNKIIVESDKKIISNKKEIQDLSESIIKLREDEVNIRLELKEIESSQKSHPSGYNLESANSHFNTLSSKKLKLDKEKNSLIEKKNNSIRNLEKIKEFKSQFPLDQLKQEKQRLDSLTKRISEFNVINADYSRRKKSIDSDLKILQEVPCGDKFKSCKFIKKAHESSSDKKEVDETLIKVKAEIMELRGAINNLTSKNIENNLEKYNAVINKEYKLQLDIDSYDTKISVLNQKIDSCEEELQKLKNLILELKDFFSDDLCIKEEKVKRRLSEVSDLIYEKEKSINNFNREIFMLEKKIEDSNREKEEYNSVVTEWKIHDLFSSAVSKKGIPTMLIKTYLPKINDEISKILSSVVNFKVYLKEEEDKNNLDIFIDYGDSVRIIECASGMEKMMASIAIRVALSKISQLPRSDLFIVDEGFGALDESNVEACGRLLHSLKSSFKTILVISHVDTIKDIVDKNLEINIKGNDSHVCFR